MKALGRENRKHPQANEILPKAPDYYVQAELVHPMKRRLPSSMSNRPVFAKHSAIAEADSAQLEGVLTKGTAIDWREDARAINFWLERDGRMLRLTLQQSTEGFLYVSMLFVSTARRLQNCLSKHGE